MLVQIPLTIYISFLMLIAIGSFKELLIKRNTKIVLILITSFSVGYIAFCYKPMVEMDLTRYFDVMALLKKNGFIWTIHESPYKDEVLFNLLFFIFAQLPNYHFLPGIITGLSYFCILYGSMVYAARHALNNTIWFSGLCVFFSFIFLRWTISGMRNQFAISVFALFVLTRKEYQKSFFLIFLSIVSMLLHKSLIIFVGFYIISGLNHTKKLSFAKYLLPLWGIAVDLTVFCLMRLPFHFFQMLGKTLDGYIHFNGTYDIRLYYAQIALVILMFLINCAIHKTSLHNDCSERRLIDYFEWVLMFTIGSIPIVILFERATHFLICIFVPMLGAFICNRKIDKFFKFIVYTGLLTVICGTGAYQAWDAINHLRF